MSCVGEATTTFGSRVVFEVRSGLALSSRGHVLQFPGLEVSLQPQLGAFVPVVPELDLDMGHNARLHSIRLEDGITLDASVHITPHHTRKLHSKYVQSSEAFAAQFFFDVGSWLTKLGNFTQ